METQVINLLKKYGYQYQDGIVVEPKSISTLDQMQLNDELGDLFFQDKDVEFVYELQDVKGKLKLIKNEV